METRPLTGIGGGGAGTFSNVQVQQGGAVEVFNTTPISATDYEKVQINWNANTAQIWTRHDGTGSARNLKIGVSNSDGAASPLVYTNYVATGSGPYIDNVVASNAGATAGGQVQFGHGGLSAAVGTQNHVVINPFYNQTGTASGIALLV